MDIKDDKALKKEPILKFALFFLKFPHSLCISI